MLRRSVKNCDKLFCWKKSPPLSHIHTQEVNFQAKLYLQLVINFSLNARILKDQMMYL